MLASFLSPFEGFTYVLLRVVSGLAFTFHGLQKVFGWLGEQQEVGSQLWIGGVLELVCGIAIAGGLFTRFAAFLASGTMAVAYAQFHWQFRFDENLLPGVNKGELALIYSVLFLYIACRGPGSLSADANKAARRAHDRL